jgi:hypothetical protein
MYLHPMHIDIQNMYNDILWQLEHVKQTNLAILMVSALAEFRTELPIKRITLKHNGELLTQSNRAHL